MANSNYLKTKCEAKGCDTQVRYNYRWSEYIKLCPKHRAIMNTQLSGGWYEEE